MKVMYENGDVVVRIPCGPDVIKKAPKSSTGKSKMVASTKGFVPVAGAPDGVKLSLNLIAKE